MLGDYRDADQIRELLAKHGIELAAVALACRWARAEETAAERAEADWAISLAAAFPAAKLVLVQLPGADRSHLTIRQSYAISCINKAARRALQAGVQPTVHPNSPPGSLFRVADDYELLLEQLDRDIGFTPDVGHIAAGGMDPVDIVTSYRARIDHVHFKDIDTTGAWAPTGSGCVDFPSIVSILLDSGYRGWIVFEDECEASRRDPDGATRRNAAYARDVLLPITDRPGQTRR